METELRARGQNNDAKSKRPSESAFKQQKLPAWEPSLRPLTVFPVFVCTGLIFIAIGVVLLHISNQLKEFEIDYTHCEERYTNDDCANVTGKTKPYCICEIKFELEEDFPGKVYMYYALANFYQNHRRYVKSRDDEQLLGKITGTPSEDCKPLDMTKTNQSIVPCGAIANSMFNDKLSLTNRDLKIHVPLLKTGIAWPSDKETLFKNPENLQEVCENEDCAKPPRWEKPIWQLDEENEENNGLENEDFIVWMRTAALPSFRKLYRRIDYTHSEFKDGLRSGNYTLKVNYTYTSNATKSMILSTMSPLGGKNPVLGIAYIVVGSICTLLGILILIVHLKSKKELVLNVDDS